MRNGIVFQQVPLAPLTGEIESGSLPNWSTQTVMDSADIQKPRKKNASGGQKPPLCQMVKRWPTPTTRDWKDTGANTNYEAIAAKLRLAGVVGGSLNPQWVEWLMGYPIGWTDLKD
jgi:hypothetical protein